MGLWLIPMIYVAASVACGLALPRLEQAYLASFTFDMSVASAQAYLSAAASGMIALTGIVFAMAFVMVQFSAIAYSPRLVLWFARDHALFHSLGVFCATFLYALFTLVWVDRGGTGTVPFFSALLVAILLIASMLLFARLIQRLTDLQITSVLRLIGDKGRRVIADMFRPLDGTPFRHRPEYETLRDKLGPVTSTLKYPSEPRAIARFDSGTLVRLAQHAGGTIVMECGVGDTLVHGTVLLRLHGGDANALSERAVMRAIHLERERTFEQDPKYPIRLLADIAIKALSPAINDPTTAVQTLDQIEDLLRRLAGRELDAGRFEDAAGVVRLIIPMPTWEDYLALAFDEIRQYGASSVQVMRRLRSALADLVDVVPDGPRTDAVKRYLDHLDRVIDQSPLDAADRIMARQEDRQGLGLSHRPDEPGPDRPADMPVDAPIIVGTAGQAVPAGSRPV
jgi:uncharacterized membrane protein